AAHRLLDERRRVLGAVNARERAGDEHGAPRLPDGERDAGVGADVRLLEHDRIGRVLLDERRHPLEDRLEAGLRTLPRGRLPPAVLDRPEAAGAFVDDPVAASSRTWVDAE